jgi:hypothetical protein
MGQVCIDPNASGLVAAYDMFPVNGTIADLSGNGNTGTVNGPVFENTEIGGSMKFDGVDDNVEIADDPSQDITDDLTLSCWVNTADGNGALLSKWIVAGNQKSYSLSIIGGKPTLFISSDGLGEESESSTVSIDDATFHHLCVVYTKADDTVKFYQDNELETTKIFTTETNGIYNSTATLRMCDTGATGGFLACSLSSPQVFTRALSQSEITALYNCGASAVNFKTDYGVCESVSAESAPGELSNSPFRKESGTWKISTDTIGGDTCKVIECVTTGICQIPSAYFHGDDTQAAYGSFEFWVNKKADANTSIVGIIANVPESPVSANYSGYEFRIGSDEDIWLIRRTLGAGSFLMISNVGYVSFDAWNKYKITRSSAGEFTLYVNDALLDVSGGTGTNPATNNDHTESSFFVLNLGTGDKVAYASPNGDCSIVKYQGVV